MSQKILLNTKEVNIILHRLACQLIEKHLDFSNTILIGIQPRGTFLAKRLTEILKDEYQISDLKLGLLDITFFRDDFRRSEKPFEANQTQIDFLVEDKNVVFIDDVLYTGRSVRAAMDALSDHGRPRQIQLAILIDRGHRELPIRADYIGKNLPTSRHEKVFVDMDKLCVTLEEQS